MIPSKPSCKVCQNALELKQTFLNILWCCPACENKYPLEAFPELIDDEMEARLANVHCNRV